MKTIRSRESEIRKFMGFTLIELLVVIAIMGVLAGFTIPVLAKIKEAQKKKVARGELEFIQTALENYKAKYGAYPPANQNLNSSYAPSDRALFSQLYFELAGTSLTAIGGVNYFVTLDGGSQIKVADVSTAYGVGGFINCSKGGGEDAANAKNFITGLKPNQYSDQVTNSNVRTTELLTSVGGPDDNYKPLNASGMNPFRYICPGTNNPNSYDLWVQLKMSGKTYLICNWNKQVPINAPYP